MVKRIAASIAPGFAKKAYVKYYKNNELTSRFANILSLDILVRGGMFFLYPIYIRLMTVDEYGVYGYLVGIIGVFAAALNFGAYVAQIKQYHEVGNENRGSYIFSINAFLLLAVSAAILLIFGSGIDYRIVSFLFEKDIDYSSYRLWMILAIVVTIFSQMVYNFFMISEQIKYYQIQNVLKLVLLNFVVIMMLKLDIGDNIKVRIKYNYLMEAVILLPFCFFYLKDIRLKFNYLYVKEALYIGLPAMLSSIIGVFYSLSDRKFIEQYCSHEELGVFQLGLTLAGNIYLVFAAFQNSLLPFFFKEKDKVLNYERTIRATKKITILLLAFSIVMYCVTFLLVYFNVIKDTYWAILPIMPIMLGYQIVQAISALFANYFVYFNKNYYSIFLSIFSAVANIGLCVLLIPRIGMIGAAIATLLVSVVLCIINFMFARKHCLE